MIFIYFKKLEEIIRKEEKEEKYREENKMEGSWGILKSRRNATHVPVRAHY